MELEALDFATVRLPDDQKPTLAMARSLLAEERTICRFEQRFLHKNGRIVWAEVNDLCRAHQEAIRYPGQERLTPVAADDHQCCASISLLSQSSLDSIGAMVPAPSGTSGAGRIGRGVSELPLWGLAEGNPVPASRGLP